MKFLICCVVAPLLLGQSHPTLANTSKYAGDGRYKWTVFIRAEPAVLDSIRSVEYHLHPSFPKPVQQVTRKEGGFALRSDGWGEFQITANVVYNTGKTERLSHWLRLGSVMQTERTTAVPSDLQVSAKPRPRELTTRNDSQAAGQGQWRWTIYLVGDDSVLDQVVCVEYTLHPTFPEPIQRKYSKGNVSGRGFDFTATGWGTFLVHIKVEFRDKQVQYLTHQLVFGAAK